MLVSMQLEYMVLMKRSEKKIIQLGNLSNITISTSGDILDWNGIYSLGLIWALWAPSLEED